MLRVIAGKYRSRILEQPPLEITRPTIDRIREALFNIIQNEIPGSIVLDCFAGSGAFCIESISRGAMKAVAIEKNNIAYEVIKKNVDNLKINNLDIKFMDSIEYLRNSKNIQFDFIYLDPPYAIGNISLEAMKLIYENKLLKKYGKIIIETSIDNTNEVPSGLMISDTRIYGKTKLVFINYID